MTISDRTVPGWVAYDSGETEQLVLRLMKQDMSPAMIGAVLRDRYGIPSVKAITGSKVSEIIGCAEGAGKYPEDMLALMRRAAILRKHLAANSKDIHSGRGLQLIESRIRRIGRYNSKRGRIAAGWSYDSAAARLEVQ